MTVPHSTTSFSSSCSDFTFICGYNGCGGVMYATVTPGSEAAYECSLCGHTAMARVVVHEHEPIPPAYGARINMLMEETGCAAPLAALAIRGVV